MKIVFYKKENGKEPVKDDIEDLEERDKARVYGIIDDIKINEFNSIRAEFRLIKGKLWEIKIRLESGGYRIFYTVIESNLMVLLHSYKKKTQKAPQNELNIALKRLNNVISNK